MSTVVKCCATADVSMSDSKFYQQLLLLLVNVSEDGTGLVCLSVLLLFDCERLACWLKYCRVTPVVQANAGKIVSIELIRLF
jgi:hypothetical protein